MPSDRGARTGLAPKMRQGVSAGGRWESHEGAATSLTGRQQKILRALGRLPDDQLAQVLLALPGQEILRAFSPYIELFADVDDVFSEDDAMAAEKRQMGMGRLYRAWKTARTTLDPGYIPARDRRG